MKCDGCGRPGDGDTLWPGWGDCPNCGRIEEVGAGCPYCEADRPVRLLCDLCVFRVQDGLPPLKLVHANCGNPA